MLPAISRQEAESAWHKALFRLMQNSPACFVEDAARAYAAPAAQKMKRAAARLRGGV